MTDDGSTERFDFGQTSAELSRMPCPERVEGAAEVRSPMAVLTFNMDGSLIKQFPYRITGHPVTRLWTLDLGLRTPIIYGSEQSRVNPQRGQMSLQ